MNTRRTKTIWNNVTSGAAGASSAVALGGATNATLFVEVSGATDISIEVSPGTAGAGINDFDASMKWYPLFEDDLSAAQKLTFAGAGKAAIDISPVASEYIRFVSSNNVTVSAFVDYIQA